MEQQVAKLSDVLEQGMVSVRFPEMRVVVFRGTDGKVYALEDRCSHADVRLSKGKVIGDIIECPAHGAQFDICTGKQLCMPAVSPVRKLEVIVRDEQVYVIIPD